MAKEKWVSQEEKEWITEEIQAIKKQIAECEERQRTRIVRINVEFSYVGQK